MQPFTYHAPTRLDEALDLLSQQGGEAKLIAGGTALVIMMKQDLVQPAHLVDLRHLRPSLSFVTVEDAAVRIGALATHRQVETNSLVREHLPALRETLGGVATIRIRNAATIGGNLAHGDPALDPPAILVALDATVTLSSTSGERSVPLDSFYLDYYETVARADEIVCEVRVPRLSSRTAATYLKFLPKSEDDYATVGVAARLTLDASGSRVEEVRVALSAAGSTVIRARGVEGVLRGQAATPEAFRDAAAAVRAEVDPIADVRGSSEYKRDMAEVFVRRALTDALARIGSATTPRNREAR